MYGTNVVIGRGKANFNYFILCWVIYCKTMQTSYELIICFVCTIVIVVKKFSRKEKYIIPYKVVLKRKHSSLLKHSSIE